VVYAAQSRRDNAKSCWNWFSGADQHRDRGEPAILAGLVRDLCCWPVSGRGNGCDPGPDLPRGFRRDGRALGPALWLRAWGDGSICRDGRAGGGIRIVPPEVEIWLKVGDGP